MSRMHEATFAEAAYVRCLTCLVSFDANQAQRKMSAVDVNDVDVWIYCPICNHPHSTAETRPL